MSINFGLANNYNLFVRGSITMSDSRVQGRVAAGGTVNLTNSNISTAISPQSNNKNTFVIGGDVNVFCGENYAGNTVYSPCSEIKSYTMTNPNGILIEGSPINFSMAWIKLIRASNYWSNLRINGTVQIVNNQIVLIGDNPVLNIFEYNAENIACSSSTLNTIEGYNINVPEGSTSLINIIGVDIEFGSYQMLLNGNPPTSENAKLLIFNFPYATSISNVQTAIFGSVIAPYANITVTSPINGNVICHDITVQSEINNELFEGELPQPYLSCAEYCCDFSCCPNPCNSSCKNKCCCCPNTTLRSLPYEINIGGNRTNVNRSNNGGCTCSR